MPSSPRVFIGSASESEPVAEALHAVLKRKGADVTLWRYAFNPGRGYREQLVDLARHHDFGVFVFSPDDEVTSRGAQSDAPRDNVMYELGLFGGIQGTDRVFVVEADGAVKIPSDLLGVANATYRPPSPGTDPNSDAWENAVLGAAREIMRAVAAWQDRAATTRDAAVTPGPTAPEIQPLGELAVQMAADAARGRLRALTEVARGRLIVHAINGVGRVIGYDRLDRLDPLIYVQFDAAPAWIPRSELFLPPE